MGVVDPCQNLWDRAVSRKIVLAKNFFGRPLRDKKYQLVSHQTSELVNQSLLLVKTANAHGFELLSIRISPATTARVYEAGTLGIRNHAESICIAINRRCDGDAIACYQ